MSLRFIDDNSVIKGTIYFQFQETLTKKCIMRLIDRIETRKDITEIMHNGDHYSFLVDGHYITVIQNYTASRNAFVVFHESKEYYETQVKPHIAVPRWVLNIFNGEAENETIYVETETFVLMPDPKWDRKVENLYLLALVKDDTLYSLRDLRDNHITMLASIRDISVQYILEHFKHFGITDGHIRIFIHYYPSAWRLHIHFQHISSTIALGGNTQVGKAHLLSTVITNLVMNGNYYRDSTIECVKVQ